MRTAGDILVETIIAAVVSAALITAIFLCFPILLEKHIPIMIKRDPLSCEIVAAKVSPDRVFLPTGKRLPDTIIDGKRFLTMGMTTEVRQTTLTLRAENRAIPEPVEVMVYCDQTAWESGTDHSTSRDFGIASAGSTTLSLPISTGESTEIKLVVNSDAKVKAPWFKCFCSFRAHRSTAAGRIGR